MSTEANDMAFICSVIVETFMSLLSTGRFMVHNPKRKLSPEEMVPIFWRVVKDAKYLQDKDVSVDEEILELHKRLFEWNVFADLLDRQGNCIGVKVTEKGAKVVTFLKQIPAIMRHKPIENIKAAA